jgi:uncharacterized protein (TIGR02145 family)
VNQNAVINWRWDFGDGTTIVTGNPNPTHIYTNAGSFLVKLKSYSTEGCTDSITKTIIVDSLPAITNTVTSKVICSNTGTNITLTSNTTNTFYTWEASASSPTISGYSSAAIPTGNLINQTLVNSGIQIDSVLYQVHPLKGMCEGLEKDFHVRVYPVPNLTNGTLLKFQCDSTYTNLSLLGTTDSVRFTWTCSTNPGANLTGYSNDTTMPGLLAINQLIRNTGYNVDTLIYHLTGHAYGCIGPVNDWKIIVYPKPDLSNTPIAKSICDQDFTNVILTAHTAGTLFTWTCTASGPNITGYSVNASPTTILNQQLFNSGAAPGTVTYYIVPHANGCAGSIFNYIVTVNPLPTPPIAGNNNVCAGSTGNIYTTGSGMTNYQWSISAGGTITSGGTLSDNTVTVTWNTLGVQSVFLNYTDIQGCTGISSTNYAVTVHPLPIPVITGSASVCLNSTTVYGTTAGMSGYTWTVSPGGTISSGIGTNSISVNWASIGAQTISVNYIDAFGCTAASSTIFDVNVSLLPVPGLVGGNSICIGSTVSYSTDPGMSAYVWSVSAGGTITSGGGPTNNTVTVHWTVTGAQTVSVNYQAGPGCTAPSPTVLDVTIHSLPIPAIAGTNDLCVGSTGVIYTAQAGMTGYTWSVSAGGTITAGGTAGDNFATLTWNTVGAQTVSVNYTDGSGCTALAPTVYPVTVHALPIPAIAGPANLCNGSTGAVYSTMPGQSNYLWNLSGGGIISAGGTVTDNTVTITWNIPGIHNLTVNYYDANGCTAVSATSYAVTVYTLPVPVISGNNKICTGSTGVIYTTQAGMTNYSWAVSAGGTVTAGGSASDNTVTVTWNTPGAKTVSVNFNDLNGCTAVSATSFSVTVDPLPVPTITGNSALCAGITGIVYTTQAGMTNYTWTISAGGTITAGGSTFDNTVTVTWNTAGAQTVMINYNDLNGCTAIAPFVFPVTVYPLPIPVIAGAPALCTGTTGLVYSTQPGNSNYQWVVSIGGTITAGGNTADHTVTVTWNTPGAQSVSVNYHDLNGCTAFSSTVYPVTINPLPVPVIAGPAAVCLNSTGIYSTTTGMTNYAWTVTAGGIITGGTGTNSITVLWNTIGPKTIQVNYIDENGCTAVSPTSYSVTVNTLPVPSLTGLSSVCSGLSTTYTTDAGMNNYSWIVSVGGEITAGGGTSDNTVTVLWNTAGAQTVSVNYMMGIGCTAAVPSVYNVTVKPRPSVTNAANSTLCSNRTTSIIPTASLPGATFTWTATGSSGSVTGFNPGSGFSITDNLINTGFNIETVNYAVTPSLNGCDGTIAHYIVSVNPVADVYFNPNGQSFCSGGTTSISILSHVAGATFTWTAVGSSGNVSGFGPGSGSLIAQTLNNSGSYFENVNYDVFSLANSCAGMDNHVIVNMNPTPQVSFDMACNDIITTTNAKAFTLRGGIPLGGVYSGPGVNAGIFYPSLAGPGTITINYSYSNTWGCNSNQSQTISVINAVPFNCDNILTDIRDNNQYPTVQLGTQCWMAMNLNLGTQIPSASMQRDNCLIEKYCYNDIAGNCTTMGGLYQWDEMMRFQDIPALQGICPSGWHVPSENDWTTLFNFYISNGFAGSPLKYTGYSGYNALLDGMRFNNSIWDFTNFATFLWSSNSDGPQKAWAHAMNTYNPSVSNYPGNRSNAFSIRCIKD